MTTVTGTLLGLTAPQRVEMKAALVDVTGKPAVGYVPSLSGELVKDITFRAGQDGAWEVDLTPNDLVDSASGDTLWAIQEGKQLSGAPILTHVIVPETAGPWWVGDLRVELADAPTGTGGTVIYVPGPPGQDGTAGSTYQHAQTAPASTWQVAHSLGRYPNLSVITSDGRLVYADVTHASTDLAVITFPTPVAGTATCS
ncbi:hypothetical protein [Streptomyces sp. NPDC005548]|uniref:hypothetical protein n=1 Tax=Streptomyces sp. NPDC005548 TaxID=3364724 RepID=UPI0036C8F51A